MLKGVEIGELREQGERTAKGSELRAAKRDQHMALRVLDWHNYLPVTFEEVVQSIHLDQAWHIGFGIKVKNIWSNVGCITIKQLLGDAEKRGYIEQYLRYDSYFTVNSLFSPAHWKSKSTGLMDFRRTKDSFKRLNCAFIDLDVGRPDDRSPLKRQSRHEALERLMDLVDDCVVPEPNMIAFSGRGLYCFWLFDAALESNIGQKLLVEGINRALGLRLRSLASDCAAIPVSQVLRVPDSIHTRSGNQVRYFLKQRPRYSVGELAQFLGTSPDPATYRSPRGRIARPTPNLNKVYAAQCLNLQRADDILKIEKYFKGFTEGNRRIAIFYYAQCLRNAGIDKTEVIRRCEAMGQRCNPPCEEIKGQQISGIVKYIFKNPLHRIKNLTLINALGVSPEMARLLDLETIVPDIVKFERSATARRQRRDIFINKVLNTDPTVTAGRIAKLCHAAGIKLSRKHASRVKKHLETQRASEMDSTERPTA